MLFCKNVILPSNLFKICAILSSFVIILAPETSSNNDLETSNDLEAVQYRIKPFDDSLLPCYESQLSQLKPVQGMGRVLNMPQLNDFNGKPDNPNNIKTRFDIYTRKTKVRSIIFDYRKRPESDFYNCKNCDPNMAYPFAFETLQSVQFNPNKTTVLMIPGYRTENEVDWMNAMVPDWLDAVDINLIIVTWASANHGFYEKACANIPYVSRQITILLHYLSQLVSIDMTSDMKFLENIHIVGHSCGSHIAGLVGRDFNGLLGRVTALDPAGPVFEKFEPLFRLSRNSAKLVDVYHSNSGQLDWRILACGIYRDQYNNYVNMPFCNGLPNQGRDANPAQPGAFMGLASDIGHVNFYLNNGFLQPGCSDWSHMCDHSRVTEMLSDSLKYDYYLRRKYSTGKLKKQALSNQSMDHKLKLSRPLAFIANNYETFSEGFNFEANNCNWLLKNPNEIQPIGQLQSLASCAIPVDFVTSPSEYRLQLQVEHNISMLLNDWPLNDAKATKVFMITAPQRPLLGDHLMLKLRINSEPDWDQTCILNGFVYFSKKSTQILKTANLRAPKLGDVISIPIKPDFGLQVRSILDNISDSNGNLNETLRSLEGQLKKYLFPIVIYFTASKRKSQQKRPGNGRANNGHKDNRQRMRGNRQQGHSISKTNDRYGFMATNNESKCRLDLSYVAIQPIWENISKFYGIFTTNDKPIEQFELVNSSQFKLDNPQNFVRIQPYNYRFLHLDQVVVDDVSSW